MPKIPNLKFYIAFFEDTPDHLYNSHFMVDFDLIPMGQQTLYLNLRRFWEVTFVCFQGSWEEMIDGIGAM